MIQRLREWSVAGCLLLLIAGCGENESPPAPTTGEATEAPEVTLPDVTPMPGVVLDLDADSAPPAADDAVPEIDRPAVLGFARYLPADTEALVTFHDAKKHTENVREMELWAALTSGGEMARPFLSPGIDPEFDDLAGMEDEEEDLMDAGETITPLDFFGTEVTLALGGGGTEQMANWLTWNQRSTYHQMRNLAATLSNGAQDEDFMAMPGITGLMMLLMTSSDIYPDLFADPVASAAMDAFQMPSIYMAVRAPDGRLPEAQEMLAQALGVMTFFGEVIAPVEVERAGAVFNGYRLIGEDIAKSLKESREYMDEILGVEVIDRLIEFFSARELVALSGAIDDYAVLFIGPSIEEFVLAAEPEDSIAASDKLAFADPLLSHPFLGLMFVEKDLLETVATHASSMALIAQGLRDGFAANDADGANRDLVALLNLVSSRERALRELTRHEAAGVTMVLDRGLRIESHGGTNGMLDFSQPSRLAAMGDAPDVVMFLQLNTDPRYRTRATAYQEALFETIYAMLGRFSEGTTSENEFGIGPMFLFRSYVEMFKEEYRDDLVNLWRATAHDMSQGLGNEVAYVVDMDGTWPQIPQIPEVLLKNSKFPRATMIAPVADRARHASAWEKMQDRGGRIVTRIGTMNENDWAMPRAISSESAGFKSWFLPLPFFNDDFLPAATLDDHWFALGTTRGHSLDLLNRLDGLEPRDGGGMRFHMNFVLLAQHQREELARFIEDREEILASDEIDEAEYEEMREISENILKAVETLDALEVRCWEEDGLVRTRLHLRTRQP